ncbi:MCE family protein [Pseudonocardiaceae bacterium YIM PH 21723]|nr:MCE family protein [Pseudonocardiaceae bacterium YIM PH 21723]
MRGLGAPLTKLIIFIVVTVTATAMLALTIANNSVAGTNTYKARFSDVTALNEGDDIRVAGVKVGQVTGIRIVDQRVAEIDFVVQKSRPLPATTEATIKYKNLVGQRYISLTPGAGRGGSAMAADETIPMDRTKPALDMTALFNGFKPLFQALSPEDVNKLSGELIQVLQGEGGTIDGLLRHTASLTSTIADRDKVIGEVITNLNQVLEAINSRSAQFNDLIASVRQLVEGLAADRQAIGDAVTALGDLSVTTADLLTQARPDLKQNIIGIRDLSKVLGDNGDVLAQTLAITPVKFQKMTRIASYGSWLNFFSCEMRGQVSAPPLINKPVALPLHPVSHERCKR